MEQEVTVWHGALSPPAGGALLTDISLNSPAAAWQPRFPTGPLEFLAYVQPSLVPLHLLLGPSLRVVTNDDKTQEWFSDVLLHETLLRPPSEETAQQRLPWHESTALQSRIGILARPSEVANSIEQGPRVTEVLFYAERVQSDPGMRLLTPPPSSQPDNVARVSSEDICVRALAISSDLQPANHELLADRADESESRSVPTVPDSTLAAPSDASRKRLGLMFDKAFERRKRARQTTGQSISIAASRGASFDKPQIKTEDLHANPTSSYSASVQPRTLQPRRVAKKDAGPPQRPASRRSLVSAKATSPSRLASPLPDEPNFESRNKELVSRTVMAGMRIYGLQSSKGSSKLAADEERDAEFKAVYYQTYKGTLFAFRRATDTELLKPEAVRDVADRLLAIYCHESP